MREIFEGGLVREAVGSLVAPGAEALEAPADGLARPAIS